jgi:hypothetical protein
MNESFVLPSSASQALQRRASPPIIRALLAVLALALLQACSAIKLAYNNVPEFGYWWLDAYVDFSDSQSLAVRADLARLLAWHRAEELPRLAELLQKAQRLAASDVTPAAVCSMFADIRQRLDAVTTQAEKPVVSLALSLNPNQLANIDKKFNKGNTEWRNEWLQVTAPERNDKRLKANVERAEEFYGKLEDRQVAALRTALDASAYDAQKSYTERLRRQQDLLQTLRGITGVNGNAGAGPSNTAKPSTLEATSALRTYLERSVSSPNPAFKTYSDKLTQESCAQFAQLHNSATADQRTRAVRRLAAYERDARELNSQR